MNLVIFTLDDWLVKKHDGECEPLQATEECKKDCGDVDDPLCAGPQSDFHPLYGRTFKNDCELENINCSRNNCRLCFDVAQCF